MPHLEAVLVHGVDPDMGQQLSGALIDILEGSLEVLQPGERSIILGRLLALDLGVRIGDATGRCVLGERTGAARCGAFNSWSPGREKLED